MSKFDELYNELVAMEGVFDNFKNRKVKSVPNKSTTQFKNIEEMFKACLSEDEDPEWERRSISGVVGRMNIDLRISNDAPVDESIEIAKTGLGNIAQVQRILAQRIVDDHNSSKGTKGCARKWSTDFVPFEKKNIWDAMKHLELASITINAKNDGVQFEIFFYGKELWFDGCCYLNNAIDRKTGKVLTNFTPALTD